MTALRIILIIAAVLLGISLVRVGAKIEYSQNGLMVWLKICGLSIRVFPVKQKRTGERPKEKKAKKKEPELKRGGSFEMVKEFLPVVADAAGQLKRKISIDDFRLDLLWSVSDPAACAVGFGAANAAAGMIWPIIEQNFHVRNRCIRTAVDFESGRPTVYLLTQVTLRIGQIVSLAVRLTVRILKLYPTIKKEQPIKPRKQQKEAV